MKPSRGTHPRLTLVPREPRKPRRPVTTLTDDDRRRILEDVKAEARGLGRDPILHVPLWERPPRNGEPCCAGCGKLITGPHREDAEHRWWHLTCHAPKARP